MANENGVGRKFVPIDWAYVEKGLMAGASGVQIAADLGIHHDTLYNACEREKGTNWTQFSLAGREKGNKALLNKQYEVAMKGHPTMLLWLGKQRLDQKDVQEKAHVSPNDATLTMLQELLKENQLLKETLAKSKTDPILSGSNPQV